MMPNTNIVTPSQRHDEEYAQQGMQMLSEREKRRIICDQRILPIDRNHMIYELLFMIYECGFAEVRKAIMNRNS
jgi:hypothetical protein